MQEVLGWKSKVDNLHKKKIDMSGMVYVVNPDGYIGKSTKEEIEYAKKHHIKVEYMYSKYNIYMNRKNKNTESN